MIGTQSCGALVEERTAVFRVLGHPSVLGENDMKSLIKVFKITPQKVNLDKKALLLDSIINLAKFMARRGVPGIRSDNGTTFVGASWELKEVASQLQSFSKLHRKLLTKNIKWEFSPLYASHMGAVWKRPVRTEM